MILQSIAAHASARPHALALQGLDTALSYAQLLAAVEDCCTDLAGYASNARIAIALQNHPAWVVLDIAALSLSLPQVPLPAFFSDDQLRNAVNDAGANLIITDDAARFHRLFAPVIASERTLHIAGCAVTALTLTMAQPALANATAKITYTSGTTGHPKGVCLSLSAMLAVASSIQQAVQLTSNDQHLSVLPLSTLLENVAGVYACLLAGACVHLYPSQQVGLNGSSVDVDKLYQALANSHATTSIFIPELLKALTHYCETTHAQLPQLRFLAVGGAHVSTQLLARAQQCGLPVFEGYGLSECASVVTLNTPNAQRAGSVGKALPHVTIKVAEDGELWVKGAACLSYTCLSAAVDADGFVETGDIGSCDDDGFWSIQGRKKNIFITSYGRNVSPEWVELLLTNQALSNQSVIQQACLFGEAKPWNTAVIFTTHNANNADIDSIITTVNATLPDYARISRWLTADAPFSVSNAQLTNNGRLKRDAIWQHYQDRINTLYQDS
ncbi:MAG TPA: AMP-binding protein [Methylophilus sp.]